uniref:Uncharacterized protein n=1 Tax=Arion vulgaris TaxID=1028688 RepID=A0A0B6Y136_9EUPU
MRQRMTVREKQIMNSLTSWRGRVSTSDQTIKTKDICLCGPMMAYTSQHYT